jgi:hypothetical protein
VRLRPTFLILGAQRCGTTSLYFQLCQHPQVAGAREKEVHFFDLHHERGIGWYGEQFPTRGEAPAALAIGESSPYYLFHPHVPARVHAFDPRLRLVVLLRDPVERAISQHALNVSLGIETLPLVDALAAEPERLAGELERMLADPAYESRAYQHSSYLARGRYAEQLERWLGLFPREQVLVLRSEALFADPAEALERLLPFLGLPRLALPPLRRVNSAVREGVDDALRARLRAQFAAPAQRLAELLGDEFAW